MSELQSQGEGPNETIIASGTRIKGEIALDGPGRICGTVEGRIESSTHVEIATEGSVEGNVKAAIVEIHGGIKGNVVATQTCRLAPTARLEGELRAASLAISEGAVFVGKVAVGTEVPLELPEQDALPAGPRLQSTGEEPAREATIKVLPQNLAQSVNRNARVIKAAAH